VRQDETEQERIQVKGTVSAKMEQRTMGKRVLRSDATNHVKKLGKGLRRWKMWNSASLVAAA
jgi:hypothetical protein